jgi:hypothetical protein
MGNYQKMPGGPCDSAPALLAAAVPDHDHRALILHWLHGMKHGVGVDSVFGLDGGKLTHISLLYPLDVVGSIAKQGTPAGECIERLQARSFIVNAVTHLGNDVLLVGYPIDEAVRLAKVWRDDSDDLDLETVSIIVPTERGIIVGHIEPL